MLHNNGARLTFYIFPFQHSFFFSYAHIYAYAFLFDRASLFVISCALLVCACSSYTYFRRCINILSELRHKKVIAKVTTSAAGINKFLYKVWI